MMKLEISLVLLLCVWTTLAQEFRKLRYFDTDMDMEEKLNALMNEVRELRSKCEERAQVAFSASLYGSEGFKNFGPHKEATTLVYENVFTNIGNAYDSTTGIFTSPVKGVYFFNYVVFNPSDYATGVRLLKNGNFVVAASDNPNGQDREDTTSNSVSLALEQGDQIHLQLMENRRVYEDTWRRNTFSGHLLFAL